MKSFWFLFSIYIEIKYFDEIRIMKTARIRKQKDAFSIKFKKSIHSACNIIRIHVHILKKIIYNFSSQIIMIISYLSFLSLEQELKIQFYTSWKLISLTALHAKRYVIYIYTYMTNTFMFHIVYFIVLYTSMFSSTQTK